MNFTSIWIDDKFLLFNEKYTVLQACSEVYIDLPLFCYHEALSIAVIVECV